MGVKTKWVPSPGYKWPARTVRPMLPKRVQQLLKDCKWMTVEEALREYHYEQSERVWEDDKLYGDDIKFQHKGRGGWDGLLNGGKRTPLKDTVCHHKYWKHKAGVY